MIEHYVLQHFNKHIRQTTKWSIATTCKIPSIYAHLCMYEQVKLTLNRSPHGNKTAREQFVKRRWHRYVTLVPTQSFSFNACEHSKANSVLKSRIW